MGKAADDIDAALQRRQEIATFLAGNAMRAGVIGRACEAVVSTGMPITKANLLAQLQGELALSDALGRPSLNAAIALVLQAPDA